MLYFGCLFLDNEKDMIVDLYRDGDRLLYELKTPNHHSGNLIRNFARLSDLPLSTDKDGMPVSRGEVPCYIDAENREVYILRFANTKVANIYPDGRIERKASVPAIAKTLMSQTKDYRGNANQTIFKTYILRDYKFRSDLHTHERQSRARCPHRPRNRTSDPLSALLCEEARPEAHEAAGQDAHRAT